MLVGISTICTYIVKIRVEIVFSFNIKDTYILPFYLILDFPITYRNAYVLCQSECACLHKTVNMVVFSVKSNENTYQKGRALAHMYRVVSITKNGNSLICGYFRTIFPYVKLVVVVTIWQYLKWLGYDNETQFEENNDKSIPLVTIAMYDRGSVWSSW